MTLGVASSTERGLKSDKVLLQELEYADQTAAAREAYYTSSHYVASVLSGNPELPSRTPQEYIRRRNCSPVRDYAEHLRPVLEGLPTTLGSRSLSPHPAKVGLIADEFLYKSLDSTAFLTYVTPDNFKGAADDVEVLMVASTWRGLNKEWLGLATPGSRRRTFLLNELLPRFRARNVPIVFYSKEDPPNYGLFLELAQAADHIFTSAAEVAEHYARDCEQALSVQVLSFGVNPLHHSPVYSRRHRIADVLFAGSWFTHKYPERNAGARKIFEGVAASSRDLVIIDRNWDLNESRYFFPDEYTKYLARAVGHDLLMKLQRVTDFNINLNSVIGSSSMYANRAVELQAMGSFVISNYNAGLNNRFPGVLTAESSEDVRATLDAMPALELYGVQMEGLRRAYTDHLAHDRMADILRAVGLACTSGTGRVCAVVDLQADAVRRVVADQTLAGIAVVTPEELRDHRGDFDIAVPLSAEYRYAATHVEDLVNGFKYADVDFVLKAGPAGAGDAAPAEHERTDSMPVPAVGAFWVASEAGNAYLGGRRIQGDGYALDSLGLARRRESLEIKGMERAEPAEAVLSVVVPVYNNGLQLVHKCIRSLSRSSIFQRMQIVLVDDGSSDAGTLRTLQDLADRYPHVRLYQFGEGGSGSASRARNKGLELATAPWVTYLDPDNEAVGDAYAKLVDLCVSQSLDFALGDMLMCADTVKYFDNARLLQRHMQDSGEGRILPPPDILTRLDFYPMSIQAMVISTDWLRSLGLEQPVGALGQDSFFFQQLVHAARRVNVLPEPVHIYYGSVQGSVVNTVGPEFFRKYLPLEAARSQWLRETGQLEDYKRTRAQSFMKYWFLPKLRLVDTRDYSECVGILRQLASFYAPVTWQDSGVAAVLEGAQRP